MLFHFTKMVADVTSTTSARHDTFSDVKIFLEREHPERQHAIEVVCSSARRDMERHAKHVPYRFFCETLRLFPEFQKQQQQPHVDVNSGVATPQWPRTTTIACWHDCHPFDTTPIPIPKHTRVESGNGGVSTTFTVYGVFCSCNCAVAYILERNTYDQQNLLLRFRQMMLDVFNVTSDEVFAFEPAPPRIFLQLFGGHLHIDEFRRRSLVTRSTLLTHPFISYSMVLEENARQQQQEGTSGGASAGSGALTSTPLSGASHYPALTHTARGLRRPPPAAAVPLAPPEAEASASCLFSTFLTEKLASLPMNDDNGSAALPAGGTNNERNDTTDDATDRTTSMTSSPPQSKKMPKSKYIRKPSTSSRAKKPSASASVAAVVTTAASTTTTTTPRPSGTLAAFLNKAAN